MAYEVHLDVFDGPFELLLQLITAQQVDLYEVSLTAIVDAYLAEIARIDHLDLEASTQFLLIAATLVELKCQRLLPGPDDVDLDDDLSLLEARDYLLARLLECRTFAGAAEALAALEADASRSIARRAGPDERFEGCEADLLASVTPEQLARALACALVARVAPAPVIETAHVIDDEVSVSSAIEDVLERVRGCGWVGFRALTADHSSTAYRVACFLALLELYKQSLVELDQSVTFGELQVRWSAGEESVEIALADDYDELASAHGAGGRR